MRYRRLVQFLLVCSVGGLLSTQLGAGCTSATNPDTTRSDTLSLPHDAHEVDSGVGTLAYTARSDGRVWLYDKDDRTVLDSRHIQHGQEYRVIPDQNRVTLDDRKVYEKDLKRKHQHQIYFQSTGDRGDDSARGASDVPHSATRVASGTGELTYRTKNSGHIYVVDEDVNRIVYDHSVREDQEIVVRPDDDRIAVDGRNVFNGNLEHKHSHRIYFDRE